MAHYRFETEWVLAAPIEEVFDLLTRPDSGSWGPSSMSSEVIALGEPGGLGRKARYEIRSPLFYSISFVAELVQVEPPRLLHSTVDGDLTGTGTYRLGTVDTGTRVEFLWYVSTTKQWMNLLAPIGRPVFAWAHDRVMETAIRAMARRLQADLVSWHSTLL